jgi:F-box/leucine-rich repeat protein 14
MTDILPLEVITRALEFLWDWPERSRARLVCRRWDRAFTGLLENSLSSQQSSEGEWTPVGRYCTKHILCHLHRMPLEVLASLTAVDWSRSYLGDRINKAFMLLVDSLAVPSSPHSGRPNDCQVHGQLRLSKLCFEGQSQLKDEGLVHLANAHGGAVGQKLESLNLCRCLGVTGVGLAAIAKLSSLRELDLSHCRELPGADLCLTLQKLPCLTSVAVNRVFGVTDETLATLVSTAPTTLTLLDIGNCGDVTDAGVKALQKLPNLRVLGISRSRTLTADCAVTIAKLPLETLNMGWCEWATDKAIEALSQCSSLTMLHLDSATVTDVGLAKMSKLSKLMGLDISNSFSFSGPGLSSVLSIGGLQQLTSLRLFKCAAVTDPCLTQIAKLPFLTSLDLTDCRNISADGVAKLSDAKELRRLFLNGCHLADAFSIPVAGLPALEEFSISSLEDSALSAMGKVGKLRTLKVADCSNITDGGLTALARGSLRMVGLNLRRCEQLTDVGVLDVCRLVALKRLKVDGCVQLTDAAACAIVKACPLLESVAFSGCRRLTDATLAQLWRLRNLESVNLSRTSITDAGLKEVANLEGLQSLDLSDCVSVTDVGVSMLTRLWGLEYLSVDSCPQVTDASMRLVANLPRLEVLNAYGCENVTPQLAKELSAKGLWIRIS